jgi:hypothetical protein
MIQEIIVGIIGVSVTLVIAYKIYGFFFSKNEQKDTCGCSGCGCNMKHKHVKY